MRQNKWKQETTKNPFPHPPLCPSCDEPLDIVLEIGTETCTSHRTVSRAYNFSNNNQYNEDSNWEYGESEYNDDEEVDWEGLECPFCGEELPSELSEVFNRLRR